jgi:hypothetical protein
VECNFLYGEHPEDPYTSCLTSVEQGSILASAHSSTLFLPIGLVTGHLFENIAWVKLRGLKNEKREEGLQKVKILPNTPPYKGKDASEVHMHIYIIV